MIDIVITLGVVIFALLFSWMISGESLIFNDHPALIFEKITGSRSLSGTSMLNYYMPLKEWLDEQNDGLECGWE